MNIYRSSWHYRFIRRFDPHSYGDPSPDSCGYVAALGRATWEVGCAALKVVLITALVLVLAGVLLVLPVMALLELLGVTSVGLSKDIIGAGAYVLILEGVVAIVAAIAYGLERYKQHRYERRQGRSPSVLVELVRAKAARVCVPITFRD